MRKIETIRGAVLRAEKELRERKEELRAARARASAVKPGDVVEVSACAGPGIGIPWGSTQEALVKEVCFLGRTGKRYDQPWFILASVRDGDGWSERTRSFYRWKGKP